MNMKAIPQYPGYFADADGEIYTNRQGYLRKLPKRLHKGYYRVNVRDSNTPVRPHVEPVHKLVLNAYVGTRPHGYVCRHLNGNPLDNCVSNICWGTPKENAQDSLRHGTAVCLRIGEASIASKLKEKDIYKIKEMYEAGHTQKEIAGVFFISQRHVSDIVRGKAWSHLTARGGSNLRD